MPLTTLRTLFLSLTLALASPWLAAADNLMTDMRERTQACTACHGPQGKAGPDGYYPRLAGKPAGYLYNQLRNFQDHRRHYPLMQGLLAPLSDAYLRDIATYFSQLEVPYPAPSPSTATPEQLARGKALATAGDPARGLPACTQCHGSALTGVLPQTPGLLGLPRDYLNAQLGGWQTGQRRAPAPDCMAAVAQALRPDEVQAVTAWLAAQPVPPGAKPAAPPSRAPSSAPTLPARWRCAATAALPDQATANPTAAEAPAPAATITSAPSTDSAATQTVARGAYLARLGNCALCHTAAGGVPYAGGRGIDTPFGTVYSSNLTPDSQHGLGRWSAQDFWNALHHGTSKDGRALYPAFPYTSYTHLSRSDSDALFAFLRTVPAAPTANTPHALRWPYSSQAALGTWRALYFSPGEDSTAASAAPRSSQRGAYIAQALTHCSECHGQRNSLGALQPDKAWAGATLPGGLGYAPSLQSAQEASLATWRVEDIVALLRTGRAPAGSARGTMAEVVLHSTQYLTDDDAYALATYLQSLPQTPTAPVGGSTASTAPAAITSSTRGGKLYTQHCADCHGAQGQGRAGAIAALAGNRAVLQANPSNLIRTVLHGGFGPATAGNPRPWGMPPFMLELNNADIAAVLTYVRSSWGNAAPAVSEFDINQLRNTIRP